jgi:hypothetical protein
VAAAPAPEDVAEDVAKSLGKATEAFCAGAAAHVRVHTGMAVLVVGRALLRIAQHLVGLFGLLELDLGRLGCFTLVAVRVVLHRQLAIGLLDFLVRRVFRNAQNFVKVSFGHGVQSAGNKTGSLRAAGGCPAISPDTFNKKAALKIPGAEPFRRGGSFPAPGRRVLTPS